MNEKIIDLVNMKEDGVMAKYNLESRLKEKV